MSIHVQQHFEVNENYLVEDKFGWDLHYFYKFPHTFIDDKSVWVYFSKGSWISLCVPFLLNRVFTDSVVHRILHGFIRYFICRIFELSSIFLVRFCLYSSDSFRLILDRDPKKPLMFSKIVLLGSTRSLLYWNVKENVHKRVKVILKVQHYIKDVKWHKATFDEWNPHRVCCISNVVYPQASCP